MAGAGFGYMYEGTKWCRLRIYYCAVADSKDDDVTLCAFFFVSFLHVVLVAFE